MVKYDNIIAIDPDVHLSGVALLKSLTKQLEIKTLRFPQLMEYLQHAKESGEKVKESLIVLVEAGWLNKKSCFHSSSGCGAQRIAKNVGSNHETGRKIIEMCEYYEIKTEAVKPLKKNWSGKDGKITHEELVYFTRITGKTNQDGRDAALLAWWYAGLPIKIKSQTI